MTPPNSVRRMNRLRLLICLTSFSMLPFACKNPPDEEASSCPEGLEEGGLVISEIMADPKGQDSGKEWIEIYNASDKPIHLKGMALAVSKLDGSSEQGHRIEQDIELVPGAYFVLGSISQEESPDVYPSHIHYAYGTDISFNNTQGRLQLLCGASDAPTLIDEARYDYETKGDIKEGYAWNLDSSQGPPDAARNDDSTNWCAASNAYSEGEYGTPGEANSDCPLPLPAGQQCYDGNELRDASLPQVGEIVINEFLANPAGEDGNKEWLELKITADRDLNGLLLGKLKDGVPDVANAQMLSDPQCLSRSADSYVVFATSDDTNTNGGLTPIDFPLEFTLNNSSSGLFVALPGETADDIVLLDQITYKSVADGAASSLDPRFATAADNDNSAYFCPATTPYGDETNLGTPGAENLECQDIHPESQCFEDGVWRDIIEPTLGDLIITEYMPDPAAVGDTDGEWFEVYARKKVDLNGLDVGKTGQVKDTLNASECLSVDPEQYIIFARKTENNGGLPRVDYLTTLSLSNSNSDLFIGRNGEILDYVSYTTGIKSGSARKLKAEVLLDENAHLANDEEAQWCNAPAAETYGDGDFGSPGSENSAECSGGDDPPPDKTTCIDPDTNTERDIQFPNVGQVVITEFMANPKGIDGVQEWFEIYIPENIDLNYLQFGTRFDNGAKFTLTPPSDECIEAFGGSYIVFAKSNDPMANGGLQAVNYEFSGFSLLNSGDNAGIFVSANGNLVDEIIYTSSTEAISTSLSKTKTSAVENDVVENWCPTPSKPEYAYVPDSYGTPGVENPVCPEPLPPGKCLENGQPRDILSPNPGELVITEFMANPKAVGDTAGEWFEVFIKTNTPIDLNNLELGKLNANNEPGLSYKLTSETCMTVQPSSYIVLANSNDPALNGGNIEVDFTYTSLSISNDNSSLSLAIGGILIDAVKYTSTAEGKAASLDLMKVDAVDNDDYANNWCLATMPYGDGDLGTPGVVNPACQ